MSKTMEERVKLFENGARTVMCYEAASYGNEYMINMIKMKFDDEIEFWRTADVSEKKRKHAINVAIKARKTAVKRAERIANDVNAIVDSLDDIKELVDIRDQIVDGIWGNVLSQFKVQDNGEDGETNGEPSEAQEVVSGDTK